MVLAEIGLGTPVTVQHVGGERSFRRRLMELGLVPGTRVEVVGSAPLGDPIELLVRGASLSIRRAEARSIDVTPVTAREKARPAEAKRELVAEAVLGGAALPAASEVRGAP